MYPVASDVGDDVPLLRVPDADPELADPCGSCQGTFPAGNNKDRSHPGSLRE